MPVIKTILSAKLPAPKECPARCPKCEEGDLAGGGPLVCRYTCGHKITKAELPGDKEEA